MENIENTVVYDDIYSTVILTSLRSSVVDNDKLKWHEDNEMKYLTLKEIYQQLKAKGYECVIYVWEEQPLSGTIYMCGNHEEGKWVKHGTTMGYA